MGCGDVGMKLADLYKNKQCPHQPRYICDGSKCAKFTSCMMDEIDSLHIIGAINNMEADELDRELIKTIKKYNDGT